MQRARAGDAAVRVFAGGLRAGRCGRGGQGASARRMKDSCEKCTKMFSWVLPIGTPLRWYVTKHQSTITGANMFDKYFYKNLRDERSQK
jgi:hypothetical protein